jgi:SAM-dependent methyltransferase
MTDTQYDEFALAYDEKSGSSPTNAYYDRPAILALAGNVSGLSVLDIGCAGGRLTEQLADRGAEVTGVDLSRAMIEIASARLGGRARFHRADLGRPLDFLSDSSFDLVTASLVLHYLENWGPTLGELRRVLRPGGQLIMSVHHPEDWHWFDRPDYFRTELITDEWSMGEHKMRVQFYRRPLSRTFGALRDAGFTVDELVEPQPLEECATVDPRFHHLLRTAPRFLYFRAISPA